MWGEVWILGGVACCCAMQLAWIMLASGQLPIISSSPQHDAVALLAGFVAAQNDQPLIQSLVTHSVIPHLVTHYLTLSLLT